MKKINFINLKEKTLYFLALTIGLFHLLNAAGLIVLSTLDIRIFHVLVMFLIVFISNPIVGNNYNLFFKFLDTVLITTLTLCLFYILNRWEDIALSGGETKKLDSIVGFIFLLIVLEATRRGVGIFLTVVCFVFFTYPFYSQYLPGVFESRGYSLFRVSEFLTTTSDGIFGVPVGVSATYIILFTIFGSFLTKFGAGDFFFKLSSHLTKNLRAAGAKTAVIFSTLVGMISGAAASNVAVTGTMTIPMMKREGYKSHEAGAIEAVVSTGGQIMPPIMGAAAFIMAEVVGIPYSSVMKAALIPALLFFTSIYFVVDFQAGKNQIVASKETVSEESFFKTLVNGLRFVIPFVTLIIFLVYGYSPFKASFYAICIILTLEILHRKKIDKEIFINCADAIVDGSKNVASIAVACAAAGIIAGVLSMTGLGSKIAGLIIYASGGITIVALILTMLTAIILGMGLPTTAAYLVLATVVAPALTKLGVPLLTAHMFVFFYGCLSTITPPVALASFVAAGISGASINQVGWTAFRFGLPSYIIPFFFFFGPGFFLDGDISVVITTVVTAFFGIYLISSSLVGYLKNKLGQLSRLILFSSGLLLMIEGYEYDIAGVVIYISWILFIKIYKKKYGY